MYRQLHISSFLLLLALSLTALSSCKLEGEEIGKLYGRWRLRSITSDGQLVAEPDTVFLSFQADVYQYQPNWQYDWGTYTQRDGELTLNPLAYQSGFGFRDLMHNNCYDGLQPICFQIIHLTEKQMTLQRNDTLWQFRKFLD